MSSAVLPHGDYDNMVTHSTNLFNMRLPNVIMATCNVSLLSSRNSGGCIGDVVCSHFDSEDSLHQLHTDNLWHLTISSHVMGKNGIVQVYFNLIVNLNSMNVQFDLRKGQEIVLVLDLYHLQQ